MTDWKSMFFRLVELSRPEKIVNDEGEIIGWATHEDGQHYPIHAAQGGSGSSNASSSGGKSSGGSGKSEASEKSKNYKITTPDGTTLHYSSVPGHPNQVFNSDTNEVVEIKGGIKAIQERAKNKGWKIESYEEEKQSEIKPESYPKQAASSRQLKMQTRAARYGRPVGAR